jgi:hypothetical protein
LDKIQALKMEIVLFPTGESDDSWLMWVDGIHSETNKRRHGVFSQDPSRFSHRHNYAGLCYEVATHLFKSEVVWINGPFKAGENDKGNFVRHGLSDKLRAIGKNALGDRIYNGHNDVCSTFTAFDEDIGKTFKSRGQMRHEQFNGMLKGFGCLYQRFRHVDARFKTCFEAVSVIWQYRMEHGEPLFNIMAGIDI